MNNEDKGKQRKERTANYQKGEQGRFTHITLEKMRKGNKRGETQEKTRVMFFPIPLLFFSISVSTSSNVPILKFPSILLHPLSSLPLQRRLTSFSFFFMEESHSADEKRGMESWLGLIFTAVLFLYLCLSLFLSMSSSSFVITQIFL